MSTIKSTIDPRADLFRSNAEAMSALVKDLREKVSKISEGGGEQAREKHIARGKLLPAIGSMHCWTPARHFSSSPSSRVSNSTRTKSPAAGSFPVSAGSAGASASLPPMTQP